MKTVKFDPAEFLDDEAFQAELISEALETGDAKLIAHANETVSRAKGITQRSKKSGVTRGSL